MIADPYDNENADVFLRYHSYEAYRNESNRATAGNETLNFTVTAPPSLDTDGIDPYMIGVPVVMFVFLLFGLLVWFCVFTDRRRRRAAAAAAATAAEDAVGATRQAAGVPLPDRFLTSNNSKGNKVGMSSPSITGSRRRQGESSDGTATAAVAPGASSEDGDEGRRRRRSSAETSEERASGQQRVAAGRPILVLTPSQMC